MVDSVGCLGEGICIAFPKFPVLDLNPEIGFVWICRIELFITWTILDYLQKVDNTL